MTSSVNDMDIMVSTLFTSILSPPNSPIHVHDKAWSAVATLGAVVLGKFLLNGVVTISRARKRGREGGMERGREGGRERGMEGGREGERDGGREGGREGRRE